MFSAGSLVTLRACVRAVLSSDCANVCLTLRPHEFARGNSDFSQHSESVTLKSPNNEVNGLNVWDMCKPLFIFRIIAQCNGTLASVRLIQASVVDSTEDGSEELHVQPQWCFFSTGCWGYLFSLPVRGPCCETLSGTRHLCKWFGNCFSTEEDSSLYHVGNYPVRLEIPEECQWIPASSSGAILHTTLTSNLQAVKAAEKGFPYKAKYHNIMGKRA